MWRPGSEDRPTPLVPVQAAKVNSGAHVHDEARPPC